MKRGLTFRTVAASLALCAIVAAVFVVLLLSIRDLRSSSQLARHSEEVIAASNRLEKTVLDLETGHRGYVITHQEQFLQPWTAARGALPDEVGHLEALVGDNPDQERRAREIGAAALSYLHTYSEPLVAAERRSPGKGREIVAAGSGKRRVDALRVRFADFVVAEQELATGRRHSSNSAAHRAILIGFGGLGGLVLIVLLFAGYLSRLIVSPVRRVAAAAEKLGLSVARVYQALHNIQRHRRRELFVYFKDGGLRIQTE